MPPIASRNSVGAPLDSMNTAAIVFGTVCVPADSVPAD
jgi:hypothetical protein